MLHLLLPALIPSWRFFDRIGPAPRIEFAMTGSQDDPLPDWREVRPRPARVPFVTMLGRLFWNRRRNESLYLVSCAERLVEDPTAWRARELWDRVADIVRADASAFTDARHHDAPSHGPSPMWLRIRIVESMREGSRVPSDVVYESAARRLDEPAAGVSA